MYFCVGTFLTALKICKAASVKQKMLGEAVFKSLCPGFDCGDDDSSISAVFRGKRNLNSYLQVMMDDLNPTAIAVNFEKNVLPLLDENKHSLLVRLVQEVVEQDSIDEETHVELVNRIKKKDLVRMDDIVLSDFLVGLLLYAIKNTDNLNKEMEVKTFKEYAIRYAASPYRKVNFIQQYSSSAIFHDDKIRPMKTLYKQSGNLIDVISADLFDVETRHTKMGINIVIPVNTTFETKFEERLGTVRSPLVSVNTIHGQWLEYIRRKGVKIADIDKIIEQSLQKNGTAICGVSDSGAGKKNLYPISSIASVDMENTTYYLVAISRFSADNRAMSEKTYIQKSMNALLDYYDIHGQGNDLYIPLIGSGRSRTGMSSEESFQLIREILLDRKNDIYGRIHIVIHPRQLDEIELGV